MKKQTGFTLIEVIVTIVILAIAATAFLAYFGRAFTGSAIPARQVQRQYALIQKMETVTAQYRQQATAGTLNLSTISCPEDCTCTITQSLPDYTTAMPHLQVTCSDGEQTVFSIFTQ